jgi:hypothetical protein
LLLVLLRCHLVLLLLLRGPHLPGTARQALLQQALQQQQCLSNHWMQLHCLALLLLLLLPPLLLLLLMVVVVLLLALLPLHPHCLHPWS